VSVQDERELRERLGGLLGEIEPRPAPVFAAMRQGRGIRMRRWVAAAAGLAIIAGGVAAIPALFGARPPAPATHRHYHYTESVHPPGKNAQVGLISSGTQDGHQWKIVMSGHGRRLSVSGAGLTQSSGPDLSSPEPVSATEGGGPGPGGNMTYVAAVRKDVTSVAITLAGGKTLNLVPVPYQGHRYIGVVWPYGIPVESAVAYHGSTELAYSVPRDRTWLENWWLPGQVGPARYTGTVGAGVTDGRHWRYAAQIGPWGYCYSLNDGTTDCLTGLHPVELHTASGHISPMLCGPFQNDTGTEPTVVLAAAGPDVWRVVVTLSDGTTQRISTVDADGARMLALGYGHGLKVVSTTEFDAAGAVVGTAPASTLNCR